jgi:NAD(P)-dependent dehydrogenase (short-subunit alcohol dehydrogenase family)
MPLGRLGTVEEAAAAIRFLAGADAAWITGQVFAVDGGHTLRGGPDVTLMFT